VGNVVEVGDEEEAEEKDINIRCNEIPLRRFMKTSLLEEWPPLQHTLVSSLFCI
jgi:hypothetical protein